MQSNNTQVSNANICDESAATMDVLATVAALGNITLEDTTDTSNDSDLEARSSSNIKPGASNKSATTPAPSTKNTLAVTAPADPTNFPWARLSGELRNKIYRAYFDIFQEERKNVINFEPMAPMFLNLLQADRKIRSEAGPIFYEEYLPFDCFRYSKWTNSCSTILWRIQALSSFVALRDVHMRVSVRYLKSNGGTEDFRMGNEVAKYISRATGDPIWAEQSRRCACGWHEADDWCWQCYERTYERRIGGDFLVRYNGDGSTAAEWSLFIEGPLAEFDWSEFTFRYPF
jgi:hypothetical protein